MWRIPGGAAAFAWVREHSGVSGLFMAGAAGNGTFIVREEFEPGLFSNAQLLDLGCIPWTNNRFLPCTFERVGVLVNQLFTVGAMPPALLLYSRDFALPWQPS